MLITPETSEERIRLIDKHTDGFIYMVSSAAITGVQKDFGTQKQAYFQRIAAMKLRNPRMIGFGISNKQTSKTASANAAGAIIGSKFVTLLGDEKGDAEAATDKLLKALKQRVGEALFKQMHGETAKTFCYFSILILPYFHIFRIFVP